MLHRNKPNGNDAKEDKTAEKDMGDKQANYTKKAHNAFHTFRKNVATSAKNFKQDLSDFQKFCGPSVHYFYEGEFWPLVYYQTNKGSPEKAIESIGSITNELKGQIVVLHLRSGFTAFYDTLENKITNIPRFEDFVNFQGDKYIPYSWLEYYYQEYNCTPGKSIDYVISFDGKIARIRLQNRTIINFNVAELEKKYSDIQTR